MEFRRHPLEAWVTSGQQLCTYRDYLHCIANFCATVVNVFSKKFSQQHQMWKTYFEVTGETDDEVFHVFAQFLWNELALWIVYALTLFLVTVYVFSFKKICRKDCTVFENIVVQGFCPLKTRSPIGFCLKLLILRPSRYCLKDS